MQILCGRHTAAVELRQAAGGRPPVGDGSVYEYLGLDHQVYDLYRLLGFQCREYALLDRAGAEAEEATDALITANTKARDIMINDVCFIEVVARPPGLIRSMLNVHARFYDVRRNRGILVMAHAHETMAYAAWMAHLIVDDVTLHSTTGMVIDPDMPVEFFISSFGSDVWIYRKAERSRDAPGHSAVP